MLQFWDNGGLTIWQILSKWRQSYTIPNSNVEKFFSKLWEILGKFLVILCKRNANCGEFSQIFSNVM